MSASSSLPDELVVWRRFDATNPAHFDTVVVDEGTGVRHLKGGALRFDEDGCSVFRGDVLESLGLEPLAIASPPHTSLAHATRNGVESFTTGFAEDPSARAFNVVADPLFPDPKYNPAHALIQHLLVYTSNTKRRRAEGELARVVFKFETP